MFAGDGTVQRKGRRTMFASSNRCCQYQGVRQAGFGWLFVLASLAIASGAAAIVTQRWVDQNTRQRERDLMRIGDLYAVALGQYRSASPGNDKRFPADLRDLTEDTRFAGTRRHLRTLYPDPVTGQLDWILERDARGDITGLRSKSANRPWARTPQTLPHVDLGPAERYRDWLFTPRSSS